ncbi:MAG: site-specific integrase [Verrucomicrobiota bacterium]
MASLLKRPESPFWFASFQDAKGRWLKKSTKTKDRALATRLAIEWETAAKAGRSGRLVESQCRRVLSEILEQATGVPLNFHTCKEWLDEWVAGKVGTTGARTLLKYKQVCRDFLTHLGDRQSQSLTAISARDVRGFRDALAKDGHSPCTVNQTVKKVLSSPFTAAQKLGYITVNPCIGVESLKDDAQIEKDVFTPAQVEALCNTAGGDWKGAILTGYFTGLRLKDVTNLCWEAIDAEVGILRTTASKTGGHLTIPISGDLQKWLRAQPRGGSKTPIFTTLAGKSGTGKSGLSMQFKRIMERTGIVGRVLRQAETNSAGRSQSSLSFHSLRHSFNSALANAGVSQELRQKLTGHASTRMNDRYTHHEEQTLRDAVSKIPSLRSNVH